MAWYRSTTEESGRGSGGVLLALFLVIVLVLIVAVATGVIYFRRTDSTTEIIIDQNKIESGADQAVEQGKTVLREAGKNLQELGEKETNKAPE